MKPLITFPDVCAHVATILRDALASRTEPFAQDAHVSTYVPPERTLDTATAPYVLVAQDGGGEVRQHALLVVELRVTCWHATEDDTYDLAQLSQGLLLSYSGDSSLRSLLPLLSPFIAADVDTGSPIASFSVSAYVTPNVLAQVKPTATQQER